MYSLNEIGPSCFIRSIMISSNVMYLLNSLAAFAEMGWQEFCSLIPVMEKSTISNTGIYFLIILFFAVPYFYVNPPSNAYWILALVGIGLALFVVRIFKGYD